MHYVNIQDGAGYFCTTTTSMAIKLPVTVLFSRSVLYYFRMADLLLTPVELPSKVKLEHVCIHFVF